MLTEQTLRLRSCVDWARVMRISEARNAGVDTSRIGEAALIDDDLLKLALEEEQANTHTGNHCRNHFVNVPTAPGEPCRG